MQATHALLPGTQAPLPGPEAAFIGLAVFAVVTLDHDSSGLTGYLARGNGPRVLLVTFVGYLCPSGFGEEIIVYGMTWLLLLSGVRNAVAHGAGAGDAELLNDMTYVPRRLWAALWIAGTLLAIVIGGKWLVLRS